MSSLQKYLLLTKNVQILVNFLRFSSSINRENVVLEEAFPQKLLKVAIIGMPNAGKSTLINCLMDRRVCPVSSKVHTTKKKSLAIFTQDDAQIVFLDTPGIVTVHEKKKYNLDKSFMTDKNSSLQQANIIGIVHDVSNSWTRERIDMKIIRLLKEHQKKPSFLILNKVDLIKHKKRLLELTRKLTVNRLEYRLSMENVEADVDDMDVVMGWPNFSEVFMISSLTGDGIGKLQDYLLTQAKPAPWMFPEEQYSNETSETLIVNCVRAKLLELLPHQIPYTLEPEMELFEKNEHGKITAVVIVKCPNERTARIVAGNLDGKIKLITTSCQEDLQNIFRNYVRLKLVIENKKK